MIYYKYLIASYSNIDIKSKFFDFEKYFERKYLFSDEHPKINK
jgi:hypothetical protein